MEGGDRKNSQERNQKKGEVLSSEKGRNKPAAITIIGD